MKKNQTTLIIMGIALFAFLLVKIVPLFSWPKTHETGKIKYKEREIMSPNLSFSHEGNVWLLDSNGDTLTTLKVEFAKTEQEIKQGMMNRSIIQKNEGMLFIFEEIKPRSFWMKNTPISLDIIFFNETGYVDSFYKSATPNSENTLPSQGSVKYVLEVGSGFVNRVGISKSTKLSFESVKM